MRSIAIDGPAGAGKSSIAKEISKKPVLYMLIPVPCFVHWVCIL